MEQKINHVEVPAHIYERFLDLKKRAMDYEIPEESLRYEIIELLSPYWDHTPEPWELTEVSLKKAVVSFSSGEVVS